jgi:hypothetical protein
MREMRNNGRVLALLKAVLATGLLALPTVASAQEQEVDPGAGTSFVGSTFGGLIQAAGEPTLTCESYNFSGEFISKTTATMTWDSVGCHTTLFGFTVKCHSPGTEFETTVATTVQTHFITYNNKPAALLTGPFSTIICGGGFLTMAYGGKGVIGTITSPACKTKSKSMTIAFSAVEGKQEDRLYTGVEYSLAAETEKEGTSAAATYVASLTLSSQSELEMTCQ